MTAEFDEGRPMDLIYLDFSKAFDVFPTCRLLSKLRAHRIEGNVLKWMDGWLTGRQQRVVLNGEKSDWADVTSGVPQGSVLGPIAFVIFINDLDQGADLIKSVLKFADDTKLAHTVLNEKDRDDLQTTLNNLCDWSDKWCMRFNTGKCKVVHVGKKNNEYDYNMKGSTLGKVSEEKDIGVVVHSSLKPSRQCASAYQAASAVLHQIVSSFHYRDRHTFLKLYKTYVRPHVEFASSSWCPWTNHDIEIIEKVQMKAVGMISGLCGNNYEEKLKELGMQSLEARRLRYDMIETYKTIHGLNKMDKYNFFKFVNESRVTNTRLAADPLNLVTQRSNTEVRRNFWSQRVVGPWNRLPAEVKRACNTETFKTLYDAHVAATG